MSFGKNEMSRKRHWILLLPGIWTVITLAVIIVADSRALLLPKAFSNFILLSWVITIPAAVIGSIIGIVSFLRRTPASPRALIFIYVAIFLVAIYLVIAFLNLPNLGG